MLRKSAPSAAGWAHDGMNSVAARQNGVDAMWVLNSTDVGVTWSAPQNITSQVWSDAQHTPSTNNGHGIQTSSGRLIVPGCSRPGAMVPAMHMEEHSSIVYSDGTPEAVWHDCTHCILV